MSDGHDLFDSDDEGEAPKVAAVKPPVSNTQIENDTGLKDFTTSIFGDDSDDDDDIFGAGGTSAIASKYNFDDDDDEDDNINAALEDSDDDADFGNKRKRLSKSKSSSNDASASKKLSKKNKLASLAKGDRGGKEDGRIKKKSKEKRLKRSERSASKSSGQAGEDGELKGDSGDEYDSGDEVVANEDDERFIAGDDDLDYLVKEYDEDGQNFEDERPEKKKKASSKKASSGGGGDASSVAPKEKDPLTLTMEMLKRPKQVVMSDNEKAQITTDLLTKMEIACRQDDDMYRRGQPAIYKLQLLPVVQKIVGMKTLHTTLLDYDVLAAMKEWIEPRDAKTLPSLAVRTAIYEMLLRLPCQVDHLKRCAPGKQPIGATIVALRKHQSETVENKRLLKEIMEKWCRPIFGKSTDPRSMSSGYENPEMREIAVLRLQQQRQEEISKLQSSQAATSASGAGGLNTILGGASDAKKNAGSSRARTPFSSGFLFTVQPEFKPLRANGGDESGGGRVVREEGMDEGRTKMLRIMKDTSRGGAATVGIKTNPRAMNVSLNGKNKG